MPPLGAIFKLVGGLGLIGLIVALLMMAAVVVIPIAIVGFGIAFYVRWSRHKKQIEWRGS